MIPNLLIGTYTERLPHVDGHARGILGGRFDDGRLSGIELLAELRNPSFLEQSPAADRIYAACETYDFDGEEGGGLAALRRSPKTGRLELLGARPTGGGQPCHVALDPSGRFALTTNYTDGSVAVFRLGADGAPVERTALVRHEGSGPHATRQDGPHTHIVVFCPWSSTELLVTDLGTDEVVPYVLGDDGTLTEGPGARIRTAPGAGPRHLAFHPDGRHLFVLNELDNTLLVLRRDGDALVEVAVAPTVTAAEREGSTAGALRLGAGGRTVFATNRGTSSNSVALFSFEPQSSDLALRRTEPSRGAIPRDVVQSPDGRHVLVANQDSDGIAIFGFDAGRAELQFLEVVPAPTPVALTFVSG